MNIGEHSRHKTTISDAHKVNVSSTTSFEVGDSLARARNRRKLWPGTQRNWKRGRKHDTCATRLVTTLMTSMPRTFSGRQRTFSTSVSVRVPRHLYSSRPPMRLSWRKSRESLRESVNRKEKIMTADEIQRRRRALLQ